MDRTIRLMNETISKLIFKIANFVRAYMDLEALLGSTSNLAVRFAYQKQSIIVFSNQNSVLKAEIAEFEETSQVICI